MVPIDKLKLMYSNMAATRAFEETVMRLFSLGKVHGTAHFCVGEKATATGVCAAIEAAGPHLRHPPRARAEHRQGHEREDNDGRVPWQSHRGVQWQGWVHARRRGRGGEPRSQRDRGRRDTDRGRGRSQHRDAEDRPDRGLLLRRWCDERGHVKNKEVAVALTPPLFGLGFLSTPLAPRGIEPLF